MVYIENVDGTEMYALIVEKRFGVWEFLMLRSHSLVLRPLHLQLGVLKRTFQKLPFSCRNSFLDCLPQRREEEEEAKKSATYLTVCSNIQSYTETVNWFSYRN